jgi:hypothetical protein
MKEQRGQEGRREGGVKGDLQRDIDRFPSELSLLAFYGI